MSVPKRLVRLLPYLRMGSSEHEEHAEEHHMARDAACLGIMDLYCRSRSDLRSLDIEEANMISGAQSRRLKCSLHVMRTHMDYSPNQ